MSSVLLNHTLVDSDQARIPVDDRGFLFGDGVFETILVREGIPYLWEYHLRRLEKGLEAIGLAYDTRDLLTAALKLIAHNKVKNGVLRLHITRGSGGRGYLPPPVEETHPTLIMQTYDLPATPPERVMLCVSSYEKISPKALPVHAKLAQGMNSILARLEAEKQQCFDALLLDAKGRVAECSSSNLFWYRNRTLYTPSLATGCLAGVVRERIIELSEYRVKAGNFSLKHLLRAKGVFLTNSVSLIVPVHGFAGHRTRWETSDKLARIYQLLVEQDIERYLDQHKNLALGASLS